MKAFAQLEEVEKKYESVCHRLQSPDIMSDTSQLQRLMKERSSLEKVVLLYRRHKELRKSVEDSQEILKSDADEDLRQLAKEELSESTLLLDQVEQELKVSLLPKDPNDDKNIILEIRAGAGGDEASLFVQELFTAYKHYGSSLGFRTELLSLSPGNVGGAKEIVAMISGDQVYSRLKYESGVHRVQRVPKTESQGRVHTSTITVAVIPEAEEMEISIDPQDIRIDVMRASGAGGQHVNTTDSAVRITHKPSSIVVYCQEGKSQHANKDRAMKILMSRLKDAQEQKALEEASSVRLAQIGTGDRSERIRTYNFPQTRVTDHRVGLTLHCLDTLMKGDMAPIIEPVGAHYQAQALQEYEDNQS